MSDAETQYITLVLKKKWLTKNPKLVTLTNILQKTQANVKKLKEKSSQRSGDIFLKEKKNEGGTKKSKNDKKYKKNQWNFQPLKKDESYTKE